LTGVNAVMSLPVSALSTVSRLDGALGSVVRKATKPDSGAVHEYQTLPSVPNVLRDEVSLASKVASASEPVVVPLAPARETAFARSSFAGAAACADALSAPIATVISARTIARRAAAHGRARPIKLGMVISL
jgi:hypothetical protein